MTLQLTSTVLAVTNQQRTAHTATIRHCIPRHTSPTNSRIFTPQAKLERLVAGQAGKRQGEIVGIDASGAGQC